MQYVIAFVTGGMICALSQILMEKTKMLPGRIMVLLVCLGTLLGAIQIYEPFVEFAGAGASVLSGKRGGHIGGVGVWLSGKPDFPAENEEISVCVLVHLVVES